jgi:hypothetical protein
MHQLDRCSIHHSLALIHLNPLIIIDVLLFNTPVEHSELLLL